MKNFTLFIAVATMLLIGTSGNAQSCNASYSIQSGSASGEKLFTDFSTNSTSIELITPGGSPASSTFLPGETVSVVYASEGSFNYTYIASSPGTTCADTLTGTVWVCLVTPPTITFGINPGEFTLTDLAIDSPGDNGYLYNLGSSSITGSMGIYYPSNSTTLVANSNGPQNFIYNTNNGASGCYDSLLVSFDISNVDSCDANLVVSPMTWVSPGTFYLLDQSSNNSSGVFTCAGSVPSVVNFNPWVGNTYATIEFPSNGSYPYSYVTNDVISGCTDSIIGLINVTGYPTPCNLQAGLTVAPGALPGQIVYTDNSTGSPTASSFEPGGGLASMSIAPNPSVTVTYPANGTYTYVYTVYNGNGTCPDTISSTVTISNLPTPCAVQASLTVYQGANPGEYTIVDNSTSGSTGTFYSANLPGNAALTAGGSQVINFTSNGVQGYTYIVVDSLGNCTDTIFGVIYVSGFSCPTFAGVTITPGAGAGEFTITDNSTAGTTSEFYNGIGWNAVPVLPNPFVNYTYSANGTYSYTYIVYDSLTSCSDTIYGTLVVSGISNPCTTQANLTVTPTGTPGEFTILDASTNSTYGQFYSSNTSGMVTLSQGGSSTINFTTNGVHYYSYFVFNGNCVDSVSGTLNVTGILPPQNCMSSFTLIQDSLNPSQYYCWNNAVNSTGGTSGLSYFWDFGDGATSTNAYPTYTYGTLGTFYICLTISDASNGCISTYCDSVIVTVKATGTTINVLPAGASVGLDEETALSNITLFPNPSTGQFTLQLDSKKQATIELSIVNVAGQTLFDSREVIAAGSTSLPFNQVDLSNGMYLVKVKDITTGSTEILRLIKE